MSDCRLTLSKQFFSSIMARTILIKEMMMMMSALYYSNAFSWIFIVLIHWNNSSRIDMSLYFGLIWPELEASTLYHECTDMVCARSTFYDILQTWGTNLQVHQDWVAQTSIKFKSQLNLKCKFISCTFQVNLSVN
jgi:hypothetical protein